MDLFDGLPYPKSVDVDSSTELRASSPRTKDILEVIINSESRAGVKRKAELLGAESVPEPTVDSLHFCQDSSEVSRKVRIVLTGYSAEMQGERDAMEDRFFLLDTVVDPRITNNPDISSASFYGVFDGHNGSRAANFIADGFLDKFLSTFITRGGATTKDIDSVVSGSFVATYKALDAAFLSKSANQKPHWKDGSTATTVIVINSGRAFIANVGDSEAFLCRYDTVQRQHKAIVLTTVHSPAVYEERLRIQKLGGHVKNDRLNGVLEVSRSFGDLPYKQGTGLISTPSLKKCSLTRDDKFIVIACDGLWKALTPSEVVDFVLKQVAAADATELDVKYSMACTALAREAVKRLTGDNVSVILIRIDAKDESEKTQK